MQKGFPESFVFPNPKTNRHYSKTRLGVIFKAARMKTGMDDHYRLRHVILRIHLLQRKH
jgi:hypothetical protein